jgi:Fic family protein
MTEYIHQLPDWPQFRWDQSRVDARLAEVRHAQGRLLGGMDALGFDQRQSAQLESLAADVLKSSEIEGEQLDLESVRSSLARRLGVDAGALKTPERDVEGVVEMVLDATRNAAAPLDAERLWSWHAALFPLGRSGMRRIVAGAWRQDPDGPMQVVSGTLGRERVHFEAPTAARLPQEMGRFLDWFNGGPAMNWVLKAAVAHLWFVTVHPFEDGNGRVARAIADLALTRSEGSPQRFYSMSAEIRQERAEYYRILERTQKGTLEITPWMEWFLNCLDRSIANALRMRLAVVAKARFWQRLAEAELNPRQRRVLNQLVDGFKGKLTSSKWALLAKCSQDTAARDIQALVERGILERGASAGRSTHYLLAKIAGGTEPS